VKKNENGVQNTKDKMQAEKPLKAWELLIIAQHIGPDSNLKYCHKKVNFYSDGVHVKSIVQSNGSYKHFYSGLLKCGRTWTCPFCSESAARIYELKVNAVVDKCIENGLSLSHVVFTIYHDRTDRLANLFDQFKKVIRTMKNRQSFKQWKSKVGYIGDIKALEIRLGQNGWHLHAHYAFITSIAQEDSELWELFYMFKNAAAGITTRQPAEKAFFARGSFFDDAAKYMTKWSPGKEMTQESKKDKSEGLSFWNILEEVSRGNKYYQARAIEYMTDTYNQRRLVFSDGLKAWAEIIPDYNPEDKTEDELGKIVYTLTPTQWQAICYQECREEILLMFDGGYIKEAIAMITIIEERQFGRYRPPKGG
jgi:hypothetical protein